MMRRSSVLPGMMLLAVLAWDRTTTADDLVTPKAELKPIVARLEAFIDGVMTDQGLPAVSIALVEGPRVVWARGFGLARPKEKVPATAETVYRVGSVSKLFTDLTVMKLVEQGKLDLDLPVTTYLPSFTPKNPFGGAITLRHLMAHRAGLVRESPIGNYFDATSPSLAETVQSLNTTELVYAPGTRTKYSNAGIAVVGRVVEAVTDVSFPNAVQHMLIEPLGLSETAFEPTPRMVPLLARGRMWTYDGRTFDAPTFPLGTSAAGNLHSSALDLGRFVGVLLDGGKGPRSQVIHADTLRTMWTPQFAKEPNATRMFGIGFALGALDGHRRVGHGGAVYGFATDVSALPDDGLGVAVVISKDCANATAARIADGALRLMLAMKQGTPLPEFETTKPVAPALARRLAGRYGEGDAAIDLSARDGKLYLTPVRGGFRLALGSQGDAFVVDDPLSFGARIKVGTNAITLDGRELSRMPDRKPEPAPARWEGLIGEYGWDHNTLFIHERDGRLFALIEWFYLDPLTEVSPDVFKFPDRGLYVGESLRFTRDANGRATRVEAACVNFPRRKIDGDDGATFRIKPVRPVADLKPEALRAQPPNEAKAFRAAELVELTTLDPTIRLDIRYATTNNFLGTPLYSAPRAFLQRPAAEALIRAQGVLKAKGYSLLIHDAYRPWYVTRMFWDATPESGHAFVADPLKGSKHNRGCAVDLTLADATTGRPVAMVGGYDEFSSRSNPDYPGGTSLQRWHRALLRRTMEDQGFTVNDVEWWHFDYKDWPEYPILNLPFEKLGAAVSK
jgi:CubicO group peptidase (beta-lactamase class C family)/D-alanyl-D-alanine dipeptidase